MQQKPLFQNAQLQQQFEKDGYLVLPVLTSQAAGELRALYFKLHPEDPPQGFYSTTFSSDPAFKQHIFAEAEKICGPAVTEIFTNPIRLGASFLRKAPGESGAMPIHHDWTVTDDPRTCTATIWIPLQDVHSENGAMKVLPGSHRLSNVVHSPSIPLIFDSVAEVLELQLKTIPLQAGQGLIFHHNLLHSSHLNQSADPRLALTYGLAPQGTALCFYHHHAQDAPGRMERFAVPADFFLRYHELGQRPDCGESQGFFQQDQSPLTQAEAAALLQGDTPPIQRVIRPEQPVFAQAMRKPQFAIFRDPKRNAQLAEDGYVTFPLLSADAVADLKAYYYAHHPELPGQFYASAHVRDAAFRRRMNDKIRAVITEGLTRELDKYQALGGAFISKPAGEAGILPPHADWNIVDEQQFRSFNLWIPLVDTNTQNGAVQVLPHSHDWFDSYRGYGIPNSVAPVADELWDYMQTLEMTAGEALLYDHRLVHASHLNRSEEQRLACVFGIVPEGAEMRHHCLQGGKVTVYQSNVDFHLEHGPEAAPDVLPFLEIVETDFPEVNSAELQAFVAARLPHLAREKDLPDAREERNFWQVYTPGNIAREIAARLKKLF